ncbi:MAG: outer membrane protein transport protein [Pseudomonadota bacterium]|nr:outer membrane protein transport protein [Pseudomonadota bacterium]
MKKTMIAAGLTMALSAPAFATNGMFVHGIGQSAKGSGGAGIAYPQDSLAAGTNPAGMSFIGNRADGGLEIFIPDRSLEANASDGWAGSIPTPVGPFPYDFSGDVDGNTPSAFLVPEGGYNMDMPNGSAWSFGISAFGNGGMNATYDSHPQLEFMALDPRTGVTNTSAKIDLLQAFVMPTASYKINENHAIGVSLIVAWQSLELINAAFPGTQNGAGHQNSWGVGGKIGWQGRINDYITLGATYQSRISMSKMDDYKDALAADDGSLDIPATAGVGIAINATEQLDILFDVVWINYSDDSGIMGMSTDIGGFGWDDQTVYKLGFVYEYSNDLILRAGYNYAENPLPNSGPLDGFVSTVVPATVEHHLTLGFTKVINEDFSITGSYMHAFENDHKAGGPFPPPLTASMYQNSVGLSLNWKL